MKNRFFLTKTSRMIAWTTLRDYLYYLSDRKVIVKNNFLAGVAKGVGYSVGFWVISAVIVYFAGVLASKNLPIIGDILQAITNTIRFQTNR